MRTDAWLVKLRAALGVAMIGWELGVNNLKTWPPIFVLAVWLLGGPVEELIRFLTAGRLQINVKPSAENPPDLPTPPPTPTPPPSPPPVDP